MVSHLCFSFFVFLRGGLGGGAWGSGVSLGLDRRKIVQFVFLRSRSTRYPEAVLSFLFLAEVLHDPEHGHGSTAASSAPAPLLTHSVREDACSLLWSHRTALMLTHTVRGDACRYSGPRTLPAQPPPALAAVRSARCVQSAALSPSVRSAWAAQGKTPEVLCPGGGS